MMKEGDTVILSRPSQYAVKALSNLASHPMGSFRMASELAFEEGIPNPYLGKILQGLAKANVLRSQKGPGGGFALAREPKDIRLIQIIEAIEGRASVRAGAEELGAPADGRESALDAFLKGMQSRVQEFLESTSLEDLARDAAPMEVHRPAASPPVPFRRAQVQDSARAGAA